MARKSEPPTPPADARLMEALGPLAALQADPGVSEIMVNASDKVFIERAGKIEDAGVRFATTDELLRTMDALLALVGEALGPAKTAATVRLPDNSHMLAIIPPSAVDGPHLVIRKLIKRRMTFEDLVEVGALSPAAVAFFKSAIDKRANILVSGSTGSGKTTVINTLAENIPPDERVIILEEHVELRIDHPRAVRLAADNSPDLSFADLVTCAARMRPDRLVFGELHGKEAIHALQLMATGHDGSLASLHANGPENALARLETMCLMAELGIGLFEIRVAVADAIHLITHQARLENGSRRIMVISELRGLENDRYVLQPLFRYNPETDAVEPTGAQSRWS
ncbi:MAG: CpaF family protein [Chloroflexi bacterium]|nr:CpaF family protein [Chloroflexota bacterium]